MKKIMLLLIAGMSYLPAVFPQEKVLDIPEMDQLINDSKDEHKIQVSARNNQALVSANEAANMTLLEKLKNSYRTLQHRYNVLGSAINAAQIGLQATPLVDNIISDQYNIVDLADGHPALVLIAYQTEIEFVEKGQLLIRYIIGLSLSLGAANQMKQSDRQLLFNYIIFELNTIANLSRQTLNSMRFALVQGLFSSLNPFQSYINKDKAMVSQIITNFKALK